MLTFREKGNFEKLNTFFEKMKDVVNVSCLDEYGKKGVEALRQATPKDTGKTADSWFYEIKRSKESVSISFNNNNINDGVPIAVILQYGHGTRNGGWVEGRDYINPAIQPVFDEIAEEAWKEVNK